MVGRAYYDGELPKQKCGNFCFLHFSIYFFSNY